LTRCGTGYSGILASDAFLDLDPAMGDVLKEQLGIEDDY
jgi:hypothetical protein